MINILKSNKTLVLTDQLIYSGLNFGVTIYLARFLNTNDFGIYSTIILSLYLIISLGNAIIIQPFQVSNKSYKNSKSYSDFLFISQIIFLIITLTVTFIICACVHTFTFNFLPMAFMVSGIILHDYFRKYFLATTKIKIVLIIDSIVAASQALVIIYLFIEGYKGLNNLFILLGLSYLAAIILSVYNLKPDLKKLPNWKVYLHYHKKEGLWLGLVSFVQWGSANLFVVSLGLFISIEGLGAFRLVQSLFGVLNIIFQTFENYVLPNACKLHEVSVLNSKTYIKKVSLQSALLIGIVLLILFNFSNEIMKLTTGNKYLEYSYVIKGMCILYFILFIGYPIRLSIRMLLLNKTFFIGYLLSFIFSLLFFNYLLKHWQLHGVIFGLIVNQLIMLTFWNYQLHLKKFYLWK